MRTLTITDDVMEVLKRSQISGDSVTLPSGRLERKLYQSVNAVLENAGGKWDKRRQCHVFTSNPREKLGLAIETGAIEKLVSEKQLFQAFFTPLELASRIAEMADVNGLKVLEPSAGEGALANECMTFLPDSLVCVEMHPEYAKTLRQRGYEVLEMDFLQLKPEPVYDRVVMNPPFTKNQDIKHVEHAMQFLKPGGMLLAIMAGNTNRKWFSALEFEHVIEELPEGSFKSSGTNVKTILIKITT